jgi:surfeit locus 1 family protein
VARVAPRDLAALIFALAAAAVCARLGVWQLHRLRERRERNTTLLAARERPPLEVTRTLMPDSARGRRLHARGIYDYAHERLWRARTYQGVPGVALITPLRLADGAAVLVDRGWAPSPDAYHVDQQAYREPDSAHVLGIGMPAPRARGDVDPATLGEALPYPVLPFLIQLVPSDRRTAGPPDRPLRWPAPELTDGPHLSYAIQWFSFAVIILVGSVALARSRGRGRGANLRRP